MVTDTCPKCNAKVPEGAKFCSTCGADLSKGYELVTPKAKATSSGKRTAKTGGTSRTAKKASVEKPVVEKAADEVNKE